ncbi:MAG: GNAT family N-acetyltransferase [Rhodoblastus sp.]|nr:MAG: GNAT family N-acetyltransferase [Rhodoblastus sp.]
MPSRCSIRGVCGGRGRRSTARSIRISPGPAPSCADGFAFAWSEAEFESLLASSACLCEGAFEGDRGPLTGFLLSRRAGDEAEILTIAVAPRQRRRGVGRELLTRQTRQLAELGVARLFLEVAEDNGPALALYRRFGFREEGRRKGYYRRADGPAANALVLAKDLA